MAGRTPHEIVGDVLGRKKYRSVSREFVTRIAEDLSSRYRTSSEVEDAVLSKLHQVGAVFFDGSPVYPEWLTLLSTAANDESLIKRAAAEIMRRHASTRERLPYVDQIAAFLNSQMPSGASVQDFGCGLNPLMLPWLSEVSISRYLAFDIFEDLVSFLNATFPVLGINGRAVSVDLAHTTPAEPAQVALLLKFLPTVEQLVTGRTRTLLSEITAPRIIASFPTASLCGKSKGMQQNYAVQMRDLLCEMQTDFSEATIGNELFFVINR